MPEIMKFHLNFRFTRQKLNTAGLNRTFLRSCISYTEDNKTRRQEPGRR